MLYLVLDSLVSYYHQSSNHMSHPFLGLMDLLLALELTAYHPRSMNTHQVVGKPVSSEMNVSSCLHLNACFPHGVLQKSVWTLSESHRRLSVVILTQHQSLSGIVSVRNAEICGCPHHLKPVQEGSLRALHRFLTQIGLLSCGEL